MPMNSEANFTKLLARISASARSTRHTPGPARVHADAMGTTLLVAAAALQRWWWIALALAVPYAPAWISHFFVEHNRPARFLAFSVVPVDTR